MSLDDVVPLMTLTMTIGKQKNLLLGDRYCSRYTIEIGPTDSRLGER